jgi:small subunit ribosomal protein S8
MTFSDPLSDLLTRIRNGQRAGHATVLSPASKLRLNVLGVLKKEGFIRDYSISEEEKGRPLVQIELKYYEGEPVIKAISRVSSPGRRVYSSIQDLAKVRGGMGVAILSTPQGVMSDADARAANVGGEVLCQVF